MEVDEIQTQPSKFSRINSNGKIDSSKVCNRPPNNSSHNHHRQYPDEFDTGSEQLRSALVPTGTTATTSPALTGSSASALLAAGEVGGGAGNRLRSWQHSSRIIRVSRASGGKDRHSKVWTAKGPRDRRVRLSVTTAIQFYDLQDRLGFDQPSKAVEWLIKAAADSIAELPALNGTFPETPRQLNDTKRGTDHLVLVGDSAFDVDLDGASGENPSLAQNQSQNQPGSNLSKSSNCSSTSETSKGSGGLSLSRTEIRVKARERARVRTAKEKDKETDSTSARVVQSQQNVNRQALSHQTTSSFTQLLTSGIGLVSDDHNNTNTSGIVSSTSPQEREQQQHWCSPMDYFCSMGLMGPTSSAPSRANQNHNHPTSGFIQLGNSIPQAMTISPLMSIGGEPSQPSELHHQHYPYGLPDHHLVVPAVPTTAGLSAGSSSGHYNLNFSISSSNSPGHAGFSNSTNNRGTLQSNSSQSHYLPHLQRFSSASSSAVDVSTQLPFLLGTTVESHQHHPFQAGFQLCYGDHVDRHSDHRGKGKN